MNRKARLIGLAQTADDSAPAISTSAEISSSHQWLLADPIYQAPARDFVVQINPSYSKSKSTSGSYEADASSTVVGYSVAYGLSQNLALSVSSDLGSTESQSNFGSKFKSSGNGDVVVNLQAALPFGERSAFVAGLGYGIAQPYDAQYNFNDESTTLNRSSGGNSYQPMLGAQFGLGDSSVLGLKISAVLQKEFKYRSGDTVIVSDESNESYAAAVFGQMEVASTSLGANVDLQHAEATSALRPSLYAIVRTMARRLEIVPQVTYGTEIASSDSTASALTGAIQARLLF